MSDKTIIVWDAQSGEIICVPITGHEGSNDGSIRIWTLGETLNDTYWRLRDDNWVVDENGKLMMWIPTELHGHFCGYRNISIFNRPFYLKLRFGPE